jgi:tRNA A-37 threonylcarbamoyl transferase component Bud32
MHNDLYSDNFLVEQGHLKMIDLGSLTKLEEKDQQEDGDVETIKNYLKNIGSFLAIEFPKLSKEPLNRQTIVQIQNILRLKKEELLLQAQVVSEFNKIL